MKRIILLSIFFFLILFGVEEEICPNCGAPNPQGATFCANCGFKLSKSLKEEIEGIICPNCGVKNPKDAKFCSNCGYEFGLKVDTLRTEKIYYTSPIQESIYVELKRIREFLYKEKLPQTKQKEEYFDKMGCIILSACAYIFLLFLLIPK